MRVAGAVGTRAGIAREKVQPPYRETGDVTDKDRAEPVRVDYFSSLENRFTSATGRRVKITETRNKKILQLEYRDYEDLEELLCSLAGEDFSAEV